MLQPLLDLLPAGISMGALTLVQLAAVIGLYALAFYALPALALHRLLVARGASLCERFLVYLVAGHVVITNLVFALELLHASNAWTLAVAGAALLLYVRWRLYGASPRAALARAWDCVRRLAAGTLRPRQVIDAPLRACVASLRACARSLVRQLPSWAGVAAVVVFVLWLCVPQVLAEYGYGKYDVVVHNNWINGLFANKPFVAGVYPMGYHAVVYALSALSGVPVFVFLRLMGVVTMLVFVLVLFAVLRVLCAGRAAPFLGPLFFCVLAETRPDGFARILAGLPQEYGMVFILPALWLALRAAETLRRRERRGRRARDDAHRDWRARLRARYAGGGIVRVAHDDAYASRVGFACALSLTISVHFYAFFILALFIVAGMVVYLPRIVASRAVGRVLAMGALGLALAVWPMAVAVAGGTPLQGSIGWGLSVIAGSAASGADGQAQGSDGGAAGVTPDEAAGTTADEAAPAATSAASDEGPARRSSADASGAAGQAQDASADAGEAGAPREDPRATLRRVAADAADTIVSCAYTGLTPRQALAVPAACLALALVGAAFACMRRLRAHGLRLVTVGAGEALVVLLLVAHALGLPALMDQNRAGCFLVALMPVVPALLADAPCAALAPLARGRRARGWLRACSCALALAVGAGAVAGVGVAAPYAPAEIEYNGSITTLTSVLRDFPDDTWTIVSADDELRMGEAYGYHTESLDLLEANEYRLRKDADGNVIGADTTLDFVIPTRRVFFCVEKLVNYKGLVGGVAGEWATAAEAAGALPSAASLGDSQDLQAQVAARQVVQARMLYWVDELRRRYPRETSVFYEDDKLLVVELDQPESNWVNLAFPYGYNDRTLRTQLAGMGFDDGIADELLASAGDGDAGATKAGDEA